MPNPTLSADALRDLQALYEKRGERPDTTKAYADWLRALDESAPALLTAAGEYLVMTAERDFWRSETARETEKSQGLAGEAEKLRAEVVDEREAFEIWAKRNGHDIVRLEGGKGEYWSVIVQISWQGWSARASALPRPASGPAEAVAWLLRYHDGAVMFSATAPEARRGMVVIPLYAAPPAAGSTEG